MKIGVYVGSFNPVHKGHIKIINYLKDNNHLDKVLVIPTGNYWNKKNLINIKDRINMLKLYENNFIKIDTIHNNLEYTYEILRRLTKEYPKDKLYFIIGADNIIDFDKWKNYKELLTYNLIIINRDNVDINYYLNKLGKSKDYIIINDLNINMSSTKVRKCFINNEFKDIEKFVDKKIFDYLISNNLYRKV